MELTKRDILRMDIRDGAWLTCSNGWFVKGLDSLGEYTYGIAYEPTYDAFILHFVKVYNIVFDQDEPKVYIGDNWIGDISGYVTKEDHPFFVSCLEQLPVGLDDHILREYFNNSWVPAERKMDYDVCNRVKVSECFVHGVYSEILGRDHKPKLLVEHTNLFGESDTVFKLHELDGNLQSGLESPMDIIAFDVNLANPYYTEHRVGDNAKFY